MASSRNPDASDSRTPNDMGIVRATTLPPRARARSPAASLARPWAALAAFTNRTFQLSGRWAAADMSAISSRAHGSKVGSTMGMNSSDVPGCAPATRHSSTSSSAVA
jgi:hypothetical protein